jgi:hypothetical protein
MRLSSKFKWIAGVVAIAALTVPALAQTDAAGAGGAGGGQVAFQKQQQLSPQQQLAEADSQVSRMELAAGNVRRQLETARAARDVVKTLCLNDKLSQIDVATRSAKDRRQSLQLAVTRNDSELGNHEFTILTVLRQRSEQLTAEANQCIGEEATLIGEAKVTTTIDPTLPPDDDTEYNPPNPNIVINPPDCGSCSD